jgi:biotin carboxylase
MRRDRGLVLLIGAGPFQMPAIARLHELGFAVAAIDGNPDAPGLKAADRGFVADIRDAGKCAEIAVPLRPRGVLTVASDVAVPTVAALAQRFGLPGPTPAMAAVATDKALMRERFAAAGVPSPRFAPAPTADDAVRAARAFGFPVVVKPADNAGSRGVSYADRGDRIAEAFGWALAHSRRGAVLVEEYMEGVEISVEGFAHGGRLHVLALSDKLRTPPPYLLDTEVAFPSAHPLPLQERTMAVARAAIAATGIDCAPIHMELMLTRDGPKVVEVAARGAGFHVFTRILPWVTGVDTVEQLIRMSVGETPDFTVTRQRGAKLVFPPCLPGLVKSAGGMDTARRIDGVADLEIYIKPGDRVKPLTSGADRIGHLIVLSETRADAEVAAAKAMAALRIEIEPLAA